MQSSKRIFFRLVLAAALLFAAFGCSRAGKRDSLLKSGDKYFADGKYESAELEYLNVTKLEAFNPRAIGQLGLIYAIQGRPARAMAFLTKGHELAPDNLDIRSRLAQIAATTGDMAKAREDALYILQHRPEDTEAPAILVGTIAKPEEVASIRQVLTSLPAPAPSKPAVLVALATVDLRTGHLTEAEAELKQALALDPKFSQAYSVQGAIMIAKRDAAQAEQSFKQAAEVSDWYSPKRIQYAQLRVRIGDLAGAKKMLLEITQHAPDFLPAWSALAEIALAEKNYDECAQYNSKVLNREPFSVDGVLLDARRNIAKGTPDAAITALLKLADIYPKVAVIQFELGHAYTAAGDLGKAIESMTKALQLAPGHVEATIQLAALYMRNGDVTTAIVLLRKIIAARADLLAPRLLLAQAYSSQGNLDEALGIYTQIEKQVPDNPQPSIYRGLILVQQQKFVEARIAFERAAKLSKQDFTALEQLVNLDIREKKFPAAHDRVNAQAAADPKFAMLAEILHARIYQAQNLPDQAEAALKKAIGLEPESPAAYYLLANLYSTTDQLDKALANLNEARTRNPKDLPTLLMLGMIQDQKKNYPAARETYEKLLELNPRSTIALNNLAYLLSERFNELDRAHELAQRSRDLQPGEPHTADTLGWILFKKHQYTWALSLLEEAADKLPSEAEIQYHLGVTHYMMGEESPARGALQQALRLSADFPGNAEAKQRLAMLDLDVTQPTAATREQLEKEVAARKDDPVALVRLATVYDRLGDRAKAIATLENTLQISPNNVSVLVSLAQMQAEAKATAKALDYAKTARKLAPSDATIAQILGRIAYQTGDYTWSASLLHEAARGQTPSPELLYNLALADYAMGRVDDALAGMNSALGLGTTLLEAADARRFVEMVSLSVDPAQAAAKSGDVAKALQTDANDVPALMASGVIAEAQKNSAAARAAYEKVLARFPEFAPAKLRLAILAVERTDVDQRTMEWAQQARSAYPSNPDLSRALGILSYRKGDYPRAISLLRETLAAKDSDAEGWYYLGMSQQKSGDKAESRKSLQHALDLGLTGNAAQESRAVLAPAK